MGEMLQEWKIFLRNTFWRQLKPAKNEVCGMIQKN